MNSRCKKTFAAAAAILGACLASQAYAGCSPLDLQGKPLPTPATPQSAAPRLFQRAAFVRVDDKRGGGDFGPWDDEAPIVGLWKIQLISKGTSGVPDGTVLDDGFATWHSDGTELMNSSRPPMTSSFCMGVWKQSGHSTFKLNHFALSWDPTGTALIGPANIRETVTVDARGDTYSGTFTITQYSIDGTTVLGGASGTVVGKRINP